MLTVVTWIVIALLGLILYLLPTFFKHVEGFAGLTSNTRLQPIDPSIISTVSLNDELQAFMTPPQIDRGGDVPISNVAPAPVVIGNQAKPAESGVSMNMTMTPPTMTDSPNVLSPVIKPTVSKSTTTANVTPNELSDVANLLTKMKDAIESPDTSIPSLPAAVGPKTAPVNNTGVQSKPAAAATVTLPSGAERQGKDYQAMKKGNSLANRQAPPADNDEDTPDGTGSFAYAPINVPNPSQLLQCPTCPTCKPAPKCPPQKMCPDLSDYIRKDSIPCWNCKLK